MTDTVTIFDTTLRDGEQSPGCSMNTPEKLEVAAALVELGVDVIEAGFPIASPGDFEAVREIAGTFGDRATIAALARCRDADIDRAGAAVEPAERKRIHVFLATSAIHREHKLRMDKEDIIRHAVEGVARAKGFCEDVEFSPEDAARTETDFLCEVVEKAIEAGATTVNIPDTVGYATPAQYHEVIRTLKTQVPNIDQAVISTHCHNDLGLAVANSLAAIEAGARQVECTINGLGERAGNAALEEIVMALRTRSDYYGVSTNINTRKLFATSRLVSRITGMRVQRNKAIVGQNAFAHEAGIHQHGVLQKRETYEIMRPEDVGYVGDTLVLGKHSGRHAVRARVEELGYELAEDTFENVYAGLMQLADKKKEIYEADIIALIDEHSVGETFEPWQLVSMQVTSGNPGVPTSTICLRHHTGEEHTEAAIAHGPVDACFRAIDRIVGISASLEEFDVRGVTRGKDAQGEVTVEIRVGGKRYFGSGVSTDIVEAATRAYLKAMNRADADRIASGQKPADAETVTPL